MAYLLELTTLPVYLSYIFFAQFYELNMVAGASDFILECGSGKYDLVKVWAILEIRVFYAWIIAGVLFMIVT